jgi:heptaprenyl diphosphate synthase
MTLYETDVTRDARFARAMEDGLGTFQHTSGLEAACHAALRTTGKLLRPRILLTMAGGGSGDPLPPKAVDAAVAVELLHLASMAHDDVVDEADTRRSEPAVQAVFGTTAALLAGGWLFSRGLQLAATLGPELASGYAEAASEMCAGQMLELEGVGDVSRTEDRYFAAISGKTAAPFTWASRAGATLAGLPGPLIEEATRFGSEFGLAYQIIDDLLDLTASTEHLGKPACADVRAGIYTLPLIQAMRIDPALAVLLSGPLDASDLWQIVELTRACGALRSSRDEAHRHLGLARGALMLMPSSARLMPILDRVEAMLDDIPHG